jgi:hypothetical protein
MALFLPAVIAAFLVPTRRQNRSGCAVTALIERVEDEAPSWAPDSRWAAITRSGANQSCADRTFLLQASRSVARSGYLFVAPDWDFSVPLNRTKVSTTDHQGWCRFPARL